MATYYNTITTNNGTAVNTGVINANDLVFTSYSTSTGNYINIPEYYLSPKIVDINVYGNDKPKVVEVEFKYGYETTKIKSICCDEDEFDLKKGVYIAMSKLLYGNEYTTEGVEVKAKELSLKKDNEKMVNKAIKEYHKKIKAKEEAEEKENEEKLVKLRRKKKNDERKRRRKEKSMNELAKLIKKSIAE